MADLPPSHPTNANTISTSTDAPTTSTHRDSTHSNSASSTQPHASTSSAPAAHSSTISPGSTTLMSTNEIIARFIPFLNPVPIPINWDMGNNVALRQLVSTLLGDPTVFDMVDEGAMEQSATPAEDLTMQDGALLPGAPSATVEEEPQELVSDTDAVIDNMVPVEDNNAPLGFRGENVAPDVAVDNAQATYEEQTDASHASSSSLHRSGSHRRSKPPRGQFSPVDWSTTPRTETRDGNVILNLSPTAKLLLGPPSTSPSPFQRSTSSPIANPSMNPSALHNLASSLSASRHTIATTPPLAMTPTRSYTLPPPMEGSIAELRKATLGTAYTDAYVYGEALKRERSFGGHETGDGREGRVDMVMGAEAGERMLSPQSEEEEDEEDNGDAEEGNEDEDEDDDDDEQRDELMDDDQDQTVQGSKGAALASGVASISLEGESTADIVLKETTESNASSLSTLTSLAPSTVGSTPERDIQTNPTPSAQADSSSLPTIDATTTNFVSLRKDSTIRPISTVEPSNSAATLSVSHTASTATLSTSATTTIPFTDSQQSQTIEDEDTVHALVMVGSQDSQFNEEMYDVNADDTMGSALTSYGYEDDEDVTAPVPENTLSPLFTTPSQTPAPQVSSAGPSSSLQRQESAHGGSSFDEDHTMDTSTPIKAKSAAFKHGSNLDEEENSETTRIVQAKKELNSPITVPAQIGRKYTYIPSESPSPSRMSKPAKFIAQANPKASTSKAHATNEIAENVSNAPGTSSQRAPMKPKKEALTIKKEKPSTSQPPDDVISISSDTDDEIVVRPSQTQTQKNPPTLSQKPSTQSRATVPRPIPDARRKASAKTNSPEIVDLTTPVRAAPAAAAMSSRPQVRTFDPLSHLASTSKALSENPKKLVESVKPVPVQEKPTTHKPEDIKGKGKETAAPAPVPEPEPAPESRFSSPLTEEESEVEEPAPPVRSPFDLVKATARIIQPPNASDEDAPVIRNQTKKKISLRPAPSFASGLFDSNLTGQSKATGTTGAPPKKSTFTDRLTAKLGKSVAATRIKKRKRPEASPDVSNENAAAEDVPEREQPPLKRARARSAATTASSSSVPPVGKGKVVDLRRASLRNKEMVIKEEASSTRYPMRSPRKDSVGSSAASISTPTLKKKRESDLVWPKMQNPNFDRFVKCDECETWYHIGCVGLEPDDKHLQDTEHYVCPVCTAGIPKSSESFARYFFPQNSKSKSCLDFVESPVKKINDEEVNGLKAPCARPRCLLTYVKRRTKNKNSQQLLQEPQVYLVEALVGRRKTVVSGKGISYEYLVKWQNYDYVDATVENLDSMGMSNPGPLVEAFENQAIAEGNNFEASDTVILQEAVEAGWTNDMVYTKPK
ncbi:hypothetical protein JR316_0008964 [Psilocybe cubensis]|uniref:Uncharacterized protein n=2 Tax=Psilocybe cubensis TaxID=181762 RepID=A0ACB8GSF4_PSICU|nr:hypothetical protein JR316_0008964 [Psilocybe cubensis]KAH9478509.1 hypothetical protein JR316_0008964 [Psilocybe cubensis]